MPKLTEAETPNPYAAPATSGEPPAFTPDDLSLKPKLSPQRAVFLGQVAVNGPVMLIMFAPPVAVLGALKLLGPKLVNAPAGIAGLGMVIGSLFVGVALSWLYWSAAIPRWRDWVADHDCDIEAIQDLAVANKLVWPKGSVFEQTEFRRRDGRRGAD